MAEYGLVCARLREEGLDLVAELIEKLQAERDALKVERDALSAYFKQVYSQPDCNDCAKKDCGYKPRIGENVRINCPLWSGTAEG